MRHQDFCAIDFGTSNSAVALPQQQSNSPAKKTLRLAELEPGFTSMPTAVFYNVEDETRCYGREAVAAYVDGYDGRLMRSIKSILGSDLMETATEVGHGMSVKYIDVVTAYVRHLKHVAEFQSEARIKRVVIGRPVYFVDGDQTRDAKAESALTTAARAVGFTDVAFQFEPIAAALDYESTIDREQLVIVADIGGGTSDFSIVRVGPQQREKLDRKSDILANHGIHLAGTDFDFAVNLAAIMPTLGLGSLGPAHQGARRVPSSVYFDLATWHLINTVYAHNRVAELREMTSMYADQVRYRRLMHVITRRLGHQLAATAEAIKIDVSMTGKAEVSLGEIEENLSVAFSDNQQAEALHHKIEKIAEAAVETARMAGVAPAAISAIYFTGGSTGLSSLSDAIAASFPDAKKAAGDRFASVATGLGIYAARLYA
jgi:hypothetical chaperone protein